MEIGREVAISYTISEDVAPGDVRPLRRAGIAADPASPGLRPAR